MSTSIDNQDPQATLRIHEGAVFVARKVHDVPNFKIAALVRAGAFHDSIPGIAHFFEHLPFGKTEHYQDGEISRFFLSKGGNVNAVTSYDYTTFHAEVLKEHFRDGVRGISEMVCAPAFEERRIADEAQTIVTEWAKNELDQGRRRSMALVRTALAKNDLIPVIGTPDTIMSITATDVEAFHRREYTMDNLIVYMQGDGNPEEMLDEAVHSFVLPRGLRNELIKPYPFRANTVHVAEPDVVATHMSILFPSYKLDVERRTLPAGNLLNAMLTSNESPLLREARHDKRLVYDLSMRGGRTLRWGFDTIEMDVFPKNVPAIAEIVMRHATQIATNIDEALFRTLKENSITGCLAFLKKDGENKPQNEAQTIHATNTVFARDAYLNNLSNTTVDDVAAHAQKYLANGPVSVIYEGKIEPGFPDHNALMAMRPPSRTHDVHVRPQSTGKAMSDGPLLK